MSFSECGDFSEKPAGLDLYKPNRHGDTFAQRKMNSNKKRDIQVP